MERRTLGKSSLDLVIPIREHGDRLHLHWVRSHQTLENHCKEFGTLSKWRWLANAEADKFQTRDLEWEEQLKSKDKANKLVLHFLAERTALLFSHDKDQGPQVQFEGEVASPSKQARPAGLNRKGKLPPKSKEVLSGEADWPNKRDLKGCSVQPAPGTCVAVDFGASKWGPKCKLGAQQILPSQPDRVLDMAVRRSFIRFWACRSSHNMVHEGVFWRCSRCRRTQRTGADSPCAGLYAKHDRADEPSRLRQQCQGSLSGSCGP